MAKAFFETGIYEFVVKGGRLETGAIHKEETRLGPNGIPITVGLYNPASNNSPVIIIPWHSVWSYRKVG